jgi:NMD protein affecting ribosome stability and mRNA decay
VKISSNIEQLDVDPGTKCSMCDAEILWGELWEPSFPYDFLCSGCSEAPFVRNGPANATEAACVALRRENIALRTRLYELGHVSDELDAALSLLETMTSCDICPAALKSAYAALVKVRKTFPNANETF